MAKIGIVYYSMYGSTFELAKELAEGVRRDGGDPQLRRVAELLPPEVIQEQPGLRASIEAQRDVELARVEELPGFDGIVLGSPTRFGNMTAQLRNFLDQTGPLWAKGELSGKAAGFFTGASTIHGGHESTILTMSTFAFHHGMVVVPLGYAIAAQAGGTRTGGGPYGPSHWSPQEGKDGLDDDEIQIARLYGQHFHRISAQLAGELRERKAA
ncbi:MAG TPA: NAD(P)H:quinone oxidoreductase [Egibacteraceae bacterium]|nr:NAD(P)H:quinone oxidoreductase [Egibacteraceae bacterium]